MGVVDFVKEKLLMIICFAIMGFFILFASIAAQNKDQNLMCGGLFIALIFFLAGGYYLKK